MNGVFIILYWFEKVCGFAVALAGIDTLFLQARTCNGT
jgi:hypothetical protein